MEIIKTKIQGLYLIENFVAEDPRGRFCKTFHKEKFQNLGLNTVWRESFYSVSKKNTIRGMHFQIPPNDHEKLIYVPQGSILDVILDLRKNSSTYGNSISFEINAENYNSIYIPKGCSHGFKSLASTLK